MGDSFKRDLLTKFPSLYWCNSKIQGVAMTKRYLLTSISMALLVACGGGGSGGNGSTATPAVQTGTAEGFWNGTFSGGSTGSVAILENGETWGLYQSGGNLTGAIFGNTTSTGTTLSGNGMAFNFTSRTSSNSTFTGVIAQKSNITLDAADGSKFSGSYDSSYEQAATLANLAGNYTGKSITAKTAASVVQVSISGSGLISYSETVGNLTCSLTGTAVPRPSGKNIFNVQVTFSGNACTLGNGSVLSGVATFDITNKGLIVMATKADKSDGFVFVGVR